MGERSWPPAANEGWSPPAERPLLVSACLLGVACNHVGGASPSAAVSTLGRDRRLIPVCPETAGGLPTPRPAAEIQPTGRVVTAAGDPGSRTSVTSWLLGHRNVTRLRVQGIRGPARSPRPGSGR